MEPFAAQHRMDPAKNLARCTVSACQGGLQGDKAQCYYNALQHSRRGGSNTQRCCTAPQRGGVGAGKTPGECLASGARGHATRHALQVQGPLPARPGQHRHICQLPACRSLASQKQKTVFFSNRVGPTAAAFRSSINRPGLQAAHLHAGASHRLVCSPTKRAHMAGPACGSTQPLRWQAEGPEICSKRQILMQARRRTRWAPTYRSPSAHAK